MKKAVTIVVSVYNEEAVLKEFYKEIVKVLETVSWKWDLLFVDDGSSDGSFEILGELSDQKKNVKIIRFSRNYGHEAAMIAGIDHSGGGGIICMDADLQHPVEIIPKILERLEEGYEVINMVRTSNPSAGLVKNITSAVFYRIINILSNVKLERNASDFFAVSGKAADILKWHYREKVRFLRGYVQDLGFKRTVIKYEAHDRVAGKSKYNFRKLFQFSINTIVCFSDMPLKLGIFSGIAVAVFGIVLLVYTLMTRSGAPDGYTTIVVAFCFMFALLFILIGIIGEYIAILFTELKDRPIYLIDKTRNMEIQNTYEQNSKNV